MCRVIAHSNGSWRRGKFIHNFVLWRGFFFLVYRLTPHLVNHNRRSNCQLWELFEAVLWLDCIENCPRYEIAYVLTKTRSDVIGSFTYFSQLFAFLLRARPFHHFREWNNYSDRYERAKLFDQSRRWRPLWWYNYFWYIKNRCFRLVGRLFRYHCGFVCLCWTRY